MKHLSETCLFPARWEITYYKEPFIMWVSFQYLPKSLPVRILSTILAISFFPDVFGQNEGSLTEKDR